MQALQISSAEGLLLLLDLPRLGGRLSAAGGSYSPVASLGLDFERDELFSPPRDLDRLCPPSRRERDLERILRLLLPSLLLEGRSLLVLELRLRSFLPFPRATAKAKNVAINTIPEKVIKRLAFSLLIFEAEGE
mmetsp:Transcript_19834/g.36010  ORF Transcript_19834/g.36010 Transcript_19834/m.36010 type:complete len:134 (-) Transcript_19834:1660-2061(-)